jgi:hypothetical protein
MIGQLYPATMLARIVTLEIVCAGHAPTFQSINSQAFGGCNASMRTINEGGVRWIVLNELPLQGKRREAG